MPLTIPADRAWITPARSSHEVMRRQNALPLSKLALPIAGAHGKYGDALLASFTQPVSAGLRRQPCL
ncbi:hypothetical protein [Tenebrionicola larvae]|uniref:hypothetical protein n=1 Tax=Tenebrionicola larvae TaxID=2815733 RepID=UPI00201ED111|nr:hypothetical protein [Tenebrionicola larvae]